MPLQIGEDWIDDAFIKEEIDRVKLDYQNRSLPIPPDQDLDRLVKESIVRRILLRREAEKRNIPCSDQEVDSALMQFRNTQFRSMKKNADLLKNQSEENQFDENQLELRNYLRSRIMVDKLLDQVGRDHHEIKQEHLNYFYKDNRDDYDQKLFYLVQEVAFFSKLSEENKEKIPLEKKSFLQEMEKTARIFRDDFLSSIKKIKTEDGSSDFSSKFSSRVLAEIKKMCDDFSNDDFFVEHKNLGWHDDIFFHFVDANYKNWEKDSFLEEKKCAITPLLQFSDGFLFYVRTDATLGKDLDQKKMKLVLQRDLQREVWKNNIDLFVKKLFKETKIIDHKEF